MSKIFLSDPPDTSIRMHDCGQNNYWYYHRDSFFHDPPQKYVQLMENAQNYIDIWDPYFNLKSNKEDKFLFGSVPHGITLKILTQKGIDTSSIYIDEVYTAVKSVIPPSRNVTFGLRVINTFFNSSKGWEFHDRVLIIDRTDVYLIGGSMGNHLYPEQSTGIYKVENAYTAAFILSIYRKYWDQAHQDEIPLRSLHLSI